MQALDSSGRRISLLDETSPPFISPQGRSSHATTEARTRARHPGEQPDQPRATASHDTRSSDDKERDAALAALKQLERWLRYTTKAQMSAARESSFDTGDQLLQGNEFNLRPPSWREIQVNMGRIVGRGNRSRIREQWTGLNIGHV